MERLEKKRTERYKKNRKEEIGSQHVEEREKNEDPGEGEQ